MSQYRNTPEEAMSEGIGELAYQVKRIADDWTDPTEGSERLWVRGIELLERIANALETIADRLPASDGEA